MIAVSASDMKSKSLAFWLSPDGKSLSSSPERWDLSAAKEFVDQHPSYKVYLVRGWYIKQIYQHETE